MHHRTLCTVLTGLALMSATAALHAQEMPAPACFASDQTEEIEPRFPVLGVHADQLSQLAAGDEHVPRMAVYYLTRQMVLLERIERRLQFHSEVACASALASAKRDFAALRLSNTAFMHGNSELGIARLDAEDAQSLLARIESELAALAGPFDALKPTVAP